MFDNPISTIFKYVPYRDGLCSKVEDNAYTPDHGLSQYLETGCPNRGFIDFCVSKVWYKLHTTIKVNPIYLQILLF